MRGKPKDDDEYSAEETKKRLDATVRAMIATPPRRQKATEKPVANKRSRSAPKPKAPPEKR